VVSFSCNLIPSFSILFKIKILNFSNKIYCNIYFFQLINIINNFIHDKIKYQKLITIYLNIILYYFQHQGQLGNLTFSSIKFNFFGHMSQILHKLLQKLFSNSLHYYPQIHKGEQHKHHLLINLNQSSPSHSNHHKLSIHKEARYVSQKKRKLGEERRLAAKEKAEKLLDVGFIVEAHFMTWLANVVLVRKASGKWRMCVDYTDLNKACPKDAYHLPSIYRLVDGAAGNKVLSFLAYYGYNQIPMVPSDMIKIAFIIEDANYFYRVMPFGLKNASATYQRLMDKVFSHLMGKCVEVYVDDMVVKSPNHL